MADVESAAKFVLKVVAEDPTKPLDLNVFLNRISHVGVYEHPSEIPAEMEPAIIYVVPEGDFDASKIFTAIERQVQEWMKSRSESVTVEIHKPDGHLQVLAKQKG